MLAVPFPQVSIPRHSLSVKSPSRKGCMKLFSHILSVKTCHLIFFLVAKFAMEKIQPLVPEMDKNSEMDPSMIRGMFEQGVSF